MADDTKQSAVAEAKADEAKVKEVKKVEKTEEKVKVETKEEEKSPAEATGKKVKVSVKLQKIIDEVEKLSVLELSQLVKALEDKFGVSAAAPVALAAAPATPGTAGPDAVEEKTEFTVVLAAAGANKIAVIKAVREIDPNLGLKEAKDLVDGAPKSIVEDVKKEAAEEAKKKLEAAGAQVELK